MDCHMATVAQSATTMWGISCQINKNVGLGIFFQIKIKLQGLFSNIFFRRDENQNTVNLQGRKSYLKSILHLLL